MSLDKWRARAMLIVLAMVATLMLPLITATMTGHLISVAWPLRLAYLLVYIALLAAMLPFQGYFFARIAVLITAMSFFCALQLATEQLTGSGRITLIAMPLLVLVLAGPRAGWITAAISLSIFGAVALMIRVGWLLPKEVDLTAFDWAFQGMRMAIAMLALLALLTQFHLLQQRTMLAERNAARELEAESLKRKRLEREMARIAEAERQRLGSNLHDGLCQVLAAALLNCATLKQHQHASDASAVNTLNNIRKAIEEAMGMAYDTAKGLCPVDMTPNSLLPALERLCRETRENNSIDCRLHAEQALVFNDPARALQFYQIARESVANALKHTCCKQISITLKHDADNSIILNIENDGIRQATPGKTDSGGLGMNIMAYRAKQISGVLTAGPTPQGGWLVQCCAPEDGAQT